MDRKRRVVRADVTIQNGKIAGVGRRPAGLRLEDCDVVDVKGQAIMPGLVQAHVHLCQTLFRGMADDLPLLPWLKKRIWPFEGAHTKASLRASAQLGLAEMILGGTTCILDMGTVHHHDVVFEEMERSGIRGFSGKTMMDAQAPKCLSESTTASLRESDRLRDRWHGEADGRLGYAYAPRFILSCSEKLMRGVASRAREHGTLMHTHAAEHADERIAVKKLLGKSDIRALREYGISGPQAVLAHGVQLTKSEMKRLAKEGTRIVHCPSANLKLASGIASVVSMKDAGIDVGLGADGAPCNNLMDGWTELREMALLAKVREENASALPAMEALAVATIGGATVLGLQDQIGSIEVGKSADLIAVSVDGLHQLPGDDLPSTLAYATRPTDVQHVWVAGKRLVKKQRLLTLDTAIVKKRAKSHCKSLMKRA